MNLTGDLRYTSPAEFGAFATKRSGDVRNGAFMSTRGSARKEDAAYRQQWDIEHPLGWVEYRLAYDLDERYGRWIRRHNAVVEIQRLPVLARRHWHLAVWPVDSRD